MPAETLPHIDRQRRNGRTIFYFRRDRGPRIRLPDTYGSPEFMDAYNAALAGEATQTAKKPDPPAHGTMAALIRSYCRSYDFRNLRDTTKAGYLSRLKIIETQVGDFPVRLMNAPGIKSQILQPYRDRPGQAQCLLRIMRVLIRHALEINWLDTDPSIGIKRPKINEISAWTDDQIAQFELRWPIGSAQRLAFALMIYTGQRRSDVHRMVWSDIVGNRLHVVQQKTGERLEVPLHKELKQLLTLHSDRSGSILKTAYGKPFTVDGFSQFMRDAITRAGLPLRCQPHGLRKTAGRRLAEAGCSAKEIMAVLGHKSLAEAERYTREANRTQLAGNAIARLEAQNSQRPSLGVGSDLKFINGDNMLHEIMALPREAE